jgi:hypothetical protein
MQIECNFYDVWATLDWDEYFKDDAKIWDYTMGYFTKRDETYHVHKFSSHTVDG